MKIIFSPIRAETRLTLARAGDTLIVNGVHHDLSGVALAGPETVPSEWIAGPVRREEGRIVLTVLLPHGACAPQETLWPAQIEVTQDGEIPVPPCDVAPEAQSDAGV